MKLDPRPENGLPKKLKASSVSLFLLGFAAMGYRYAPGTSWTYTADMILKLWCAVYFFVCIIGYSTIKVDALKEPWLFGDMFKSLVADHKKTRELLNSDRIIGPWKCFVLSCHVGIGYLAADAGNYGIGLMSFGIVVLCLLMSIELHKLTTKAS